MADNPTSASVPPKPPVSPAKPVSAAPVKEPSPQDRLEALLASMRSNYEHNAPIAPAHIKELSSLVALGRGDKGTVLRHPLPSSELIGKSGGGVSVVYTAEEALDYVRALPTDVRARVHWVKVEKLLLAAVEAGPTADINAAAQAFSEALAEDRKLAPAARKPDELLPDGRIREDRFPDRRPPAPIPATPAAPPAKP
jgi:hypothetical protein